ncbi:hypothetical protein PIB30_061615 [Stylosanthes scabra]|uniref:Uncharacterized protein n=1 Tax=Stylosanthes scabra TaxID=79078 RepID=A0ABU6ZJK1_9FABA|nr:hypothetical protein [Stylosanthes scabra]
MAKHSGKGRGGGQGRGTGCRGRPKKKTGVPLNLGGPPPPTVNTPTTTTGTTSQTTGDTIRSASDGLPPTRMIPIPGHRSQSYSGSDRTPPPPPPSPSPQLQPTQSQPQSHVLHPNTPHVRRPDTEASGDPAASSTLDTCQELSFDGSSCWFPPRVGTEYISEIYYNHYKWYVPVFSMAPEHVRQFWWNQFRSHFRFRKGEEEKMYRAWRARAAKRLRDLFYEIRKEGAPTDWIPPDILVRLKEYWASEDFAKVSKRGKQARASVTCGSLHTGGSTTIPATSKKMDLYLKNKSRAEEARATLISQGASDTPPISDEEIWTQTVGGRKRGCVYGMGRVPADTLPHSVDECTSEECSTASRPDLREQITLLNRELARQVEISTTQQTRYEELEARYLRERDEWRWTHQRQQQEISRLDGTISEMGSEMRSSIGQMWNYMQLVQNSSFGSAQLPPLPSFLTTFVPTHHCAPPGGDPTPDGDINDGIYEDEDYD